MTNDLSHRRRDLVAAQSGAIALRKLRPDLRFICGNIIANTRLQMKDPDDIDFQRAGRMLAAQVAERMGS